MKENEARRLVESYTDMIMRIGTNYLKSTTDAEDICQAVLEKYITTDPQFESPVHEKAWVIRTTINMCKNELKNAFFRKTRPLEEAGDIKSETAPDLGIIDSMSLIKLSDEKKEKMISNLTKISLVRKEGTMKKRIGAKKTAILAIACIAVFAIVGFAYNMAGGIVSHSIQDQYRNFSDLPKLEEEAGIDVKALETFESGYKFRSMSINYITSYGEENEANKYKGISISYEKEGLSKPIGLYMESSVYVSGENMNYAECRKIDGVDVYYKLTQYKWVPDDYELTDEDKKRMDEGSLQISVGSQEVTETTVTNLTWTLDGVYYDIVYTEGALPADELFKIAEEIIKAE